MGQEPDGQPLLEALRGKCGFEAAEYGVTGGQVRMLARVSMIDNWRVTMQRLKAAELSAKWSLDISQVYFLKTKNDRAPLVKGWRLIVKSDNLQEAFDAMARIVKATPNAAVTVDEMPLPGGGMHRSYGDKGKGAQLLGGSGASAPSMHLLRRPT